MKIVRPYGSSRTKESAGSLRRILVDSTPLRGEYDLPQFARSYNELVIAQWISAIDKIARKPAGRKKPTSKQRAFRHKLGNACWLRMTDGNYLPGASSENRAFLADLWWFKIHPYGPGTEEPRPRRDGSLPAEPKVKGRWYEIFVGDSEPEAVSTLQVGEIAARIEQHLYKNEFRLGPQSRERKRGKIEARAESISTNVLRTDDTSDVRDHRLAWTEADKAEYTLPGDPVQAIHEAAKALEKDDGRISLPRAAEILFAHWPKVFRDSADGKPLCVKKARDTHPGMFALHEQLKQCYRRLLKRTRKDTRDHRRRNPDGRKLSALLPHDLEAALRLAEKQNTNADLGHLVRLGKIIHYTASDGKSDHTKAVVDNWPANVAGSRFWTSDGQAEIKRAEAFVRVWRHILVLAGLTLRDWVSIKAPFDGDILGGGRQVEEALRSERFERGYFDSKLLLLFGNRAGSFTLESDADCLALLQGLIETAASLRHATFHFKGRGQLLDELTELPKRLPGAIQQAAHRLWQNDASGRTGRLITVLRGVHAEHFLTAEQLTQIVRLLTDNAPAELPLPRFTRVLKRAENAWNRDKSIELPAPANRLSLENAPARLCQYTLLKLLYERPFRLWLKEQRAEVISQWIDSAVARASGAAIAMNAEGDETSRKIIAARAAELPKPSAGSNIIDFFFDLSAATASEMRVQRGYESEPEKAREQAEYIDNLLCDLIVLSFNQYLVAQKLDWMLVLEAKQTLPEHPASSLDDLQTPAPIVEAEDWQAALYLLLHLLPVEPVAQLLHQLFKWDVTVRRDASPPKEEEARLQRLFTTMTLYLDMHDAKFEGGTALVGCEPFRALFESAEGFRRVFPEQLSEESERRIPRRGLREIMRFGHLPLLLAICGGKKINDAVIDRTFALEASQDGGRSPIAVLQHRREKLHDRWVKEKRRLGESDLREYCEVLSKISEHREDSNFVNLVDHVRAYRVVMAILGRLVDFVGLFERDLYFATLALLHRQGQRPSGLLKERGIRLLSNGQIIFALGEHKTDSPHAADLLKELAMHFTDVWVSRNPIKDIRNDLAHLNMLQGGAPKPELTLWANQTRRLMAYDRKLKNAVSKSVIDLLDREGIKLQWKMKIDSAAYDLASAELSSRCATHLNNKSLFLTGDGPKRKKVSLAERLRSDSYVAIMAVALDGKAWRTPSIVEYLPHIDWQASSGGGGPRKNADQFNPQQPSSGRNMRRSSQE